MNCNKIITDRHCNTIVQNESFSDAFIYIYILQLNKNDGTSLSQTFIKENKNDKIKFTIGKDGFYTLCKLKILRDDLSKEQYPNFLTLEEKFEQMSTEEQEQFISKGVAFYKDGNYYYKRLNKGLDEVEEITVQKIIQLGNKLTSVEITYYYYFQVCKLRACYNRLAQKVLDERSGIKCNSKIDQNDIYLRDLVWSALNTIIYMAEQGQFEEASRILDSIIGCNGLCKDDNNEYSNCGCHEN